MAISFVGSVAGATGSADETVNFSSLLDSSGATPTLQQNDIVIVTMCRRATSNTASLVTTTGYAEIYSNVYSNSSDDSNLISYYKVMGATPDTSVVLTTTGFSNTQAYCVHVFRGVDTATPFDGVTPTTATQTGAVAPDAPAITPTTAGAWICAAGGGAGTSAGNLNPLTNPANMSSTANHFATGTNTRAEVALALKTDWTSGSFDPDAFGGGGTASGNGLSAATFALKPAAAGGTSYTLTAASGSFTISGTAASFRAARKITAGSGAFTLTGTSATLNKGKILSAASGAFALSGSSVTLTKALHVTAGSGTYALTGSSTAFPIARAMTADSASFALSGSDVTLSNSGGTEYTLTVSSAAFDLFLSPVTFGTTVTAWTRLTGGGDAWSGQSAATDSWAVQETADGTWRTTTILYPFDGAVFDLAIFDADLAPWVAETLPGDGWV